MLMGCDGSEDIDTSSVSTTMVQFSNGPLGPELELPFSVEFIASSDNNAIYGAKDDKIFLLDLANNTQAIRTFPSTQITSLYQYSGALYAGFEYDSGVNYLGEYLLTKEEGSNAPYLTTAPQHEPYTLARFSAPDNFKTAAFFEEAMPGRVLSVIDDGGRSPITFSGNAPKRAIGTDWSGFNNYSTPAPELTNGSLTYVRGPYQLFATSEDQPHTVLQFDLSFYNFSEPTMLELERPVDPPLLGGENNQLVITRNGEFVYPLSRLGETLWGASLTMQSAALGDNNSLIALTSDNRLQMYDLNAPSQNALIAESGPLAIKSGAIFHNDKGLYLIADGKKLIKVDTETIFQ